MWKPSECFLISLNTTKDIVSFYEGQSNYETTTGIGQIEIKNDTLLFTDLLGKQTKFIQYSTGDYDAYLKEYIKLLDVALSTRGYENLNTILESDENLRSCLS